MSETLDVYFSTLNLAIMVVKSQSPPIDIPDLDLWEFLLAKPRGFSADKGKN